MMSSEAVLERPGLFSDSVSSATGKRVSQVVFFLVLRCFTARVFVYVQSEKPYVL